METHLSKLEEQVCQFYSDRKATKEECCKAVFGKVDYFTLQALSNVQTRLRKKGFLFYQVDGLMVNLEDEDLKTSDRLKIQKRMGSLMLGVAKANVRIIESTSDVETRMLQREQFKELNSLLLRARETTYGRDKTTTHKRVTAGQKPAKTI